MPTRGDLLEIARREARKDPLADVRDDVDTQVLPIFLEEAAELYPAGGRAGARMAPRARRRHARARSCGARLHTFKGSARMAGAMRLGELTHLMESRLDVGDAPVAGSPELFEALDSDLDRIAFVLDALREGKTNVAAAVDRSDESQPRGASRAIMPAVAETAGAPTPTERTGRRAASDARPCAAAPRASRRRRRSRSGGARAMLRVRADIIDRLVNEAGEVAIARARIEGELRALKANLLELTGSVIRLRTQVREIEIQAESQIQSRLMQVGERRGGFDPLEFDRYTRFQELARSLAEGVNDVSTVQQSLLKNLDVADAALIAQARLVARCAAAAVLDPHRAVRQPVGAPVPDPARRRRGARQARQPRNPRRRRPSSTARCWKSSSARSSTCCATRSTTASSRAAQRAKAGKSETGEITLTVRQVANEIAIELADDGAGLDLEGVRAKAVAQGRIAADAQPDRRAAHRMHLPARLLDRVEGDAGLGARHRHGRRARRDHRARRPRRGRRRGPGTARRSCSTCR